MTFEVAGGGGGVDDLIWVRIFLYDTSGDVIFFLDTQLCKIFASIIRHEKFFLSAQIYFPRYFLARFYFI